MLNISLLNALYTLKHIRRTSSVTMCCCHVLHFQRPRPVGLLYVRREYTDNFSDLYLPLAFPPYLLSPEIMMSLQIASCICLPGYMHKTLHILR